MLGTIVIGTIATFTVAQGININLSADVVTTAGNMLAAESSLRARAYIAALVSGLQRLRSFLNQLTPGMANAEKRRPRQLVQRCCQEISRHKKGGFNAPFFSN